MSACCFSMTDDAPDLAVRARRRTPLTFATLGGDDEAQPQTAPADGGHEPPKRLSSTAPWSRPGLAATKIGVGGFGRPTGPYGCLMMPLSIG